MERAKPGEESHGCSCLEVANHARNRPVLRQLHDRRQRDTLAACLGDKTGSQAMPPKIPLQARQACPPLHDLAHRSGGQRRAHSLFPEPPEDCTFGNPGRLQPIVEGEGGPIEHRLVGGGGCGDPGLLGLAVLQPVDIAVVANPAQIAQVNAATSYAST